MMSHASPQSSTSTDTLGRTLHLLQLTGTFYCSAELTAPWGIELPEFSEKMLFQVVTKGHCWLLVDGDEPRLLQKGSLALIPHGTPHRILSSVEESGTPLFDIPSESISDCYETMHHGGGGEATHITCGVVRFEHAAAQHLISVLPRVIQVDTWDDDEASWLQNTIRFIASEARTMRPGGETVITRLADILVIQAIRSWIDAATENEGGWLTALNDVQVGRALTAIHRDPGRDWTVESLAREVNMSRSGFSARFTRLVGESAGHYLTRWRMQLARSQLRSTSEPIFMVASGLGYQSEAAFSRAFKRVFGVPPGSVRNSH